MTTLAASPDTFSSKFAVPNYHQNTNHHQQHATPLSAMGARAVSDDAVNLFVNYLPLSVDDAQLLRKFAAFGRVMSVKIMRHICTDAPRDAALGLDAARVQKSKGYGFVLMGSKDDAKAAMDALTGSHWDNKRLVVQVAQRLPADANVSERSQPEAPPAPGRPPVANATPEAKPRRSNANTMAAVAHQHHHQQQQQQHEHTHHDAPRTAKGFPVEVSPVDSRCSVMHLASVLEAYGPVIGAEIVADGAAARVTFTTLEGAQDAVRWLNGARVPQIAARSVLNVMIRAADRDKPRKRAPRRPTELVPTAATLRVNEGSMPPPPLHRPMPSLDVPTCDHGPYCQCGQGSSSKKGMPTAALPPKSRQHRMPRTTPVAPVASSARAQLGGSTNGMRHHDPYQSYDNYAAEEDGAAYPAAPAAPAVPPSTTPYQRTGRCASGCPYCSNGTTVILQNMPFEDAQCERALNQLVGQIGYFRYWECWGNGQAVATFSDYGAAAEAVELLADTEQMVDFFDCDAGMPSRQV
jgi:hypothetical protein